MIGEALTRDLREKTRFLVAGAWNSAFNYAVFALLLWWLAPFADDLNATGSAFAQWIGSRYFLSVQWFAWFVSVPQSTATFKIFVFRSHGGWGGEIVRSYAVFLPLQLFSSVMLWILSGRLGWPALLGQLVTMVVAAVLSYFGHKHFTFGNSSRD